MKWYQRFVTVALFVALSALLVAPLQAAASGDEFATGSSAFPTGPRQSFAGVSADEMFDSNATTATTTTGGTRTYQIIFPTGQYKSIQFIRLTGSITGGGPTLIEFDCYSNNGASWTWANDPAWGAQYSGSGRYAAGASFDSGNVDVSPRGSLGTHYECDLTIFGYGGSQSVSMSSVQGYTALGPTAVAASIYVKNLRVDYGASVYQVSWDWNISYSGNYAVTKSYSTGVVTNGPATHSGGHVYGDHVSMTFRCSVGCGSDSLIPPFTLSILDTTRNQSATIVFGSAGTSTVVIPDSVPPKIAWVQGCATGATGCGTTEAQPGHLVFRLMPFGPGNTASVVICQLAPDTDGCLDGGTSYGVSGAVAETNYDSGVIYVPAGDYKITAVNSAGQDGTTFTVSANSLSGVVGPSQVGICAPADFGCHMRELGQLIKDGFSQILRFMFVPSSGSFVAWTTFETGLGTREPLATIGAAKNVIGGFVSSLVVVNTTSCQVFNYGNVDIGFLGAGRVIPVSVSICPEQYGGGSDMYQSIRTMAGYAIYLGFAYKTYRGFAPKPVMS